MLQNPINILKFVVMLTGFFSVGRVCAQTILYNDNQHTPNLDNLRPNKLNTYREQINSAAEKIIDYVRDAEGFPKLTDPNAVDLAEFVARVIPDFRQDPNILSELYSTYKIIGAGGSGTVIKATRRDNGKEIAVKLTSASELAFFPLSKYYEPYMSGLAKSALLQEKNITDFYPKLIGVYRGPCVIMSHCLSKVDVNKFIIYGEMTLINAKEKPNISKGQYFTDNIAFETLWNNFGSYIGKFTIGDEKDHNFVLGQVPYDRAYHVSYKEQKIIFLFSKQYPILTQVDLDREYPAKYLPKLFSISYPSITTFNPAGEGHRLLKSIEVALENEKNEGKTIFDFLLEHFAKYVVSEDTLPQDNIKHYSIPEKFMALIGEDKEVMQEKEL